MELSAPQLLSACGSPRDFISAAIDQKRDNYSHSVDDIDFYFAHRREHQRQLEANARAGTRAGLVVAGRPDSSSWVARMSRRDCGP
jgi:hypothetical protein